MIEDLNQNTMAGVQHNGSAVHNELSRQLGVSPEKLDDRIKAIWKVDDLRLFKMRLVFRPSLRLTIN